MAGQDDKRKPMTQLSLPSRSRRLRFLLICGNCDMVSVADNVKNNNTRTQEGKNVIAVSENRSEDKHETDLERPFLEVKEELKSTELQDQDQFERFNQRAFDRNDHESRNQDGIERICCSSDHGKGNCKEKLDVTQQSQGDFQIAETSLQLHEPDMSEQSGGGRMQGKPACIRPNLTRQRVVGSVDSFQSQGKLVGEPEIPTMTIIENSSSDENQTSSLTKVKTNGAAAQSNRVEEKSPRGSSISPWRRVAALKWKMNKVHVKKMEKDAAVANEEYEMMLENLTLYGVL